MKRIVLLTVMFVAATFAALGCHAQVPPATTYVVNLTWTAPVASGNWTGCTTAAPCTFAIYRAPQASGACPASTSTSYVAVTTTASGTAYTDTTAPTGTTVCYIAETVQSGVNSGPSNTATATVPGLPTAPTLGTPTTSAQLEVTQAVPSGELAMATPLKLTARIIR